MKQGGKNFRWMVILMASSQILLTGFVVYWLVSQFRAEKAELHTSLKHEYLTVHNSYIDSLLMKHLIVPTLSDTMMIEVNVTETGVTGNSNDTCRPSVIMKHISLDSTASKEIFALKLPEHPDPTFIHADSTIIFRNLEEERMVRSVRLFIDHTDESYHADPLSHVFSMGVDSSVFQELLNERFDQLDWKFGLEPLDRNISGEDSESINGIILRSSPESGMPGFLVDQYAGYITGLLLPQILFALILLGLTASALLFAYRSLKKQLMLNQLRDDFIGNISHELKTPVSTVKVALEALRTFDMKKDPKVAGEYLEMASREADRLDSLVGKVLHQAVLEDQTMLLQKKSCDLREMISKVIGTLDIHIREKGAIVKFHAPDRPVKVSVDPVYMEGVIINILDNSLKYAGDTPEIDVKLDQKNHHITLSVRDNGPGIPVELTDQVFDKFFRVPAGDRHDVKGYGLGLNFASLVMKHHGGSISVKNLVTGGCEFTLQLKADPS